MERHTFASLGLSPEILKAVDKGDLMLALKSAPEELKEKFYANMSQRARDTFVEELQFLGAVKMKEVEGAQRRIVDAVQAALNEIARRGNLTTYAGALPT